MYRNRTIIIVIWSLVLCGLLLLAGCQTTAGTPQSSPVTVVNPTAVTQPTTTSNASALGTPSNATTGTTPTAAAGDAERGKQIFTGQQVNCARCHGQNGEGHVQFNADRLAGTRLPYTRFARTVRNGEGAMPKFTQDQLSDADLKSIYDWLTSLQ